MEKWNVNDIMLSSLLGELEHRRGRPHGRRLTDGLSDGRPRRPRYGWRRPGPGRWRPVLFPVPPPMHQDPLR